jgi:alkaline phosphatase
MIEEMMAFNAAVEAALEWINAHGGWEENLLIVTGDHECGYLTGPKEGEQHPERNPIVNQGKGEMPLMRWNSDSHTNQLIPFFAKGAGSEAFASFLEGEDPVRGPYLNNTGIAKALFLLWAE